MLRLVNKNRKSFTITKEYEIWKYDVTRDDYYDCYTSQREKITGMPNVEWNIGMFSPKDELYCCGIYMDIKADMPLKCDVCFEIASQNGSVSKHRREVINGSNIYGLKRITINKFLTSEDAKTKFCNDSKLTIYVTATFSYLNSSDQGLYEDCKMVQSKDWSQRLQNHGEKDFKFIVGNESIEIHKFFLTLESTVFATMLENEKFKETQTGEMTITDFKFETVKAFVAFCYGDDISDFMNITENAVELLMFADKYDMTNLKVSFEEYYSTKLTRCNVSKLLTAAHKVNVDGLKTKCVDFIKALPENEKKDVICGGLDEELRKLFAGKK